MSQHKFEDIEGGRKDDKRDVIGKESDDMAEVGEEISIDVGQKVRMKTANAIIQNPSIGREERSVVLLYTGCNGREERNVVLLYTGCNGREERSVVLLIPGAMVEKK